MKAKPIVAAVCTAAALVLMLLPFSAAVTFAPAPEVRTTAYYAYLHPMAGVLGHWPALLLTAGAVVQLSRKGSARLLPILAAAANALVLILYRPVTPSGVIIEALLLTAAVLQLVNRA